MSDASMYELRLRTFHSAYILLLWKLVINITVKRSFIVTQYIIAHLQLNTFNSLLRRMTKNLTEKEVYRSTNRRKKKKAKNFCPISRVKIGFEELEEEADEGRISHSSEHVIKEEKVSYLNETYLFCGTCWHTCWNRSLERKVLIVVLTTCYLPNCFSRSNIKVLFTYIYIYVYMYIWRS